MDTRDRRGQLLLVAGLGLAVAFVALALVLNAVVFTENLATRNHGRADDAVGFENAVERGVGGLLSEVNRYDNADYETLHDSLQAEVETWDGNASRLAAGGGSVTSTELADAANGTRIVQFEHRNVTNANGDADWTMATGVNETRRFTGVLEPTSASSPLNISVSSGSASWHVTVAEDGSGGSDVVVFRNGTQVASASEPNGTVALDVTEGTVNGTDVENWTFAEGVSGAYDISVENGSNADGRYALFVDREQGALLTDLPAGTYNDRSDGDAPTTVPAIYRATVDVTLHRSTLTYETTVSLAPESAPGGETYTVEG